MGDPWFVRFHLTRRCVIEICSNHMRSRAGSNLHYNVNETHTFTTDATDGQHSRPKFHTNSKQKLELLHGYDPNPGFIPTITFNFNHNVRIHQSSPDGLPQVTRVGRARPAGYPSDELTEGVAQVTSFFSPGNPTIRGSAGVVQRGSPSYEV